MWKHLFNTEKLKYVRGHRPQVDCILCAIRDRHPEVAILEVLRTERFIVSVNLYPYNPGHCMVFPIRHVEEFSDLSNEEVMEFHAVMVRLITALKEEFSPHGFNIGCNLGKGSGASIPHIHQHIVPRYENEIGFVDILSGTRIVVVDPKETMDRLKARLGR